MSGLTSSSGGAAAVLVAPSQAAKDATWLHTCYAGNGAFPPWWEGFGDSEENLKIIFEFFANIRDLHKEASMTSPISRYLEGKLTERLKPPGTGPVIVIACPTSILATLSRQQLAEFRKLGRLRDAAFDAFAAGELALPASGRRELPRPDGAIFFCWVEFALRAIANSIDADEWKEILPTLLRAEVIYVRAYAAQTAGGDVDPKQQFASYGAVPLRAVTPASVATERYNNLTTFDQFDAAASVIAKMALPGQP